MSNAYFHKPECELVFDEANQRIAIIDASEFIHQIRAELSEGVEPVWQLQIEWADGKPGYILEHGIENVQESVPGILAMFEKFGMACHTYKAE